MPGGTGSACSASSTTKSAYEPVTEAAQATWSPTFTPSTPSPTSTTSPAPSEPGRQGNCVWYTPERMSVSMKFSPTPAARTTICPAPAVGASAEMYSRASAPPGALTSMACMQPRLRQLFLQRRGIGIRGRFLFQRLSQLRAAGKDIGPEVDHLGDCALAFTFRDEVDIEPAVEVVGLMLQHPGEVALAGELDRVAVHVNAGHRGAVRPEQPGARPRNREAALLAFDVALLQVDRAHGVEHVPDVAHAVFGEVVHEQAQVHVHLVRRKPHSLRDGHRREHVVNERAKVTRAKFGDGAAGGVEDLLADFGHAQNLSPLGLFREIGVVGNLDPVEQCANSHEGIVPLLAGSQNTGFASGAHLVYIYAGDCICGCCWGKWVCRRGDPEDPRGAPGGRNRNADGAFERWSGHRRSATAPAPTSRAPFRGNHAREPPRTRRGLPRATTRSLGRTGRLPSRP